MSCALLGMACRALALAACMVATAGTGPAVAQQAAAPVPIEAFFKLPSMQLAKLSPSGRWLAALSALPDKRLGLVFVDLQGKEAVRHVAAAEPDNMSWFDWVTDDWVVFQVNEPDYRGANGQGSGLMSVKRDGSDARMLIARGWQHGQRVLAPNHYYMHRGKPGQPEVVVGESLFDVRGEYSHTVPKVLNIETGGTRTLDLSAPRGDAWWIDYQGRARATTRTTEGQTVTSWLDLRSGKWTEIASAPLFKSPFAPSYVDGDDTLVVDVANKDGVLDLRVFDQATGKPKAEGILVTPGFDSEVGIAALSSGKVVGVTLTLDAVTPVWFSPEMTRLQQRVDAKLAGSANVLLCNPCDQTSALLVFSYSDRDPGTYVLFEPAQDRWRRLGEVLPGIDPHRMAAKKFLRIKARDGQDLPVWVTAAERADGAPPAPAVVLVHGGPNVRGTYWSWDAESQFLASRGYVVIEPEFRGSTGYGVNHFRAGWKQWGHKMQDDISDALQHVAASGLADGKRACIMGASYGGYAALMGLAKDPDQYRCAVALAAVSDPRFVYEFPWSDLSLQTRGYRLPVTLGDPKKDEALLISGSPLEQVQRIKAPVLLVHGEKDERVPIQNAERMVRALRNAGKPVEYVVYPDEGHGFNHENNRLDFYRRVEVFLAQHLK